MNNRTSENANTRRPEISCKIPSANFIDIAWADMVVMVILKTLPAMAIGMVDRNEYKRRQAPPGIKITHRAFGKDRRLPITNRYRG